MGGSNIHTVVSMEELKEIFSGLETPVIVEGRSDVDVLEKMGAERVFSLKGRPLYKVALEISKSYDSVLVLTDFDSEGIKIARKLNVYLERFGVVPNNSLRAKIKNIVTKEGISQIENIA